MNSLGRYIIAASLLFFLLPAPWVKAQQSNAQDASVGNVLSSIFDVRRAPPAKSMGLLHGTFLDGINSERQLQLALVIDATESMEDELAAIRKNLPNLVGDLNRLQDGSFEAAIVTYSDIGDKPVPVTQLQLFKA